MVGGTFKQYISAVLLGVLVVLLVLNAVLGVQFGKSIAELQTIEPTEGSLPGAALLGAAFAYVTLWIGYAVGVFLLSCVGVIVAAVHIKITPDERCKRVSTGFFVLYCLLALASVLLFVYLLVGLL